MAGSASLPLAVGLTRTALFVAGRNPRRRSEFVTTLTLESAIAPAANAGLSSCPVSG